MFIRFSNFSSTYHVESPCFVCDGGFSSSLQYYLQSPGYHQTFQLNFLVIVTHWTNCVYRTLGQGTLSVPRNDPKGPYFHNHTTPTHGQHYTQSLHTDNKSDRLTSVQTDSLSLVSSSLL